jgi:biotin transporter BioY
VHWTLTGNVRRLRRKSLIGQLVLFLLGVELMLFASFTCFDLPTATRTNLARWTNTSIQEGLVYFPQRWQREVTDSFPVLNLRMPEVRYSPYVPMAPAVLFLGYVFGLPLGFLATLAFVVLGLIGPHIGFLPLAAGGGLEYYRQPTFGYLIGMVLAAWFAGRVTMTENNSLRQIVVVLGGLLILHVAGLTYLVGSSLGILLFEGEAAYLHWQPWLAESIRNYSWYSWYALPYDALFSLAAIGLAFPFRWLTSVLTAPDIAMRSRPRWNEERLEEQEQVTVAG